MVAVDADLAGLGGLGPVEEAGEHGAGLAAVVVDGLFAQEDQVGAFLLGDGVEQFGDAERFERFLLGDLDVDGAVGAHGEGGAERVGAFGGAGADGDDVFDWVGFAFAEADGFFEGELVEGVERVFDSGRFDACVGFVDAGFDLWGLLGGGLVGSGWVVLNRIAWAYGIVNHPLDGD